MKLDSNNLPDGDDQPQDDVHNETRQSTGDLLEDILSQFSFQRSNGHGESNPRVATETSSLIEMLQQTLQIRPALQTFPSENGSVEGIDPSSPLGNSLRSKFTELEEISQRLKSRLNQVICDDNIILSPDTELGSLEADLERDLNTDCQDEDLTPQEFSVLMRSVENFSTHLTSKDIQQS